VIDLVTIVPTRSRPEAVERVVAAWEATGAFVEGAELLFVVDRDDPRCAEYRAALITCREGVSGTYIDVWRPLVPKLNTIATSLAVGRYAYALGFAGDDHLPRTEGWVGRYLAELRAQGTGIVSCPDGYRPDDLPTQWAMTADIVRALGAMVPAPVEHLYCDDAVRALGRGADCFGYLDDVLIEHMHPVAGKAERDPQYDRVNGRAQYKGDRRAYHLWREDPIGLARDVDVIRKIIEQGVPA
jgi:hypothetical protein